jgi:very-short-patch-repair endonuclease
VLDTGLGTCLDTALLFAATLEQAGLFPVVVLAKGHAFAGVWLQPQEFAALLTEEAAALRKRIALKELIVFETTMATNRASPGFARAIAEADRTIAEEREEAFVFALDVRRARMQKLRPLAIALAVSVTAGSDVDEPDPAGEALEAAPPLPDFDLAEPELPPATAEGRLERWQRKLLDLTVRNRLLNVKPGTTALHLICPDPARLEDQLADGASFRIVPAPALEGTAGRDAALHQTRTGEILDEDYARDALDKGELLSPLDAAKLDAQLVDLYRKSRSDMAEGGANTLFLSIGFLNWQKSANDTRSYRAPLILVPVKLERRSIRSGVRLSHQGEETRFNLTLLQMLRQDFDLDIPELAAGLPADESGVDVPLVWNLVRRAVRDTPGFEVVGDVVLGTFSFAKYLMWKDLVDRTEALKANRVVRHLLDSPREPYACDIKPPRPDLLDEEISPADLFTPLPADSSQLSAVVGSARGCDFVLDGPPGTGKSQTIANMIAHNLALGRKVLFVAEKRAALDVVYRRLVDYKLGPFCLELHSNKASKQDVLSQLDNAWTTAEESPAEEWSRRANELKARRDTLNRYVKALHARRPNGLTLHHAIGRVVRDGAGQAVWFDWPASISHDEAGLEALREAARRLDLNRTAAVGAETFAFVGRTEWSNAWQGEVLVAAADLAEAARNCATARVALLDRLGVKLGGDAPSLAALAELARILPRAEGLDLAFAFAPDASSLIEHARQTLPLIEAYKEDAASLSTSYAPDVIRTLPLPALKEQWAAAEKAFLPLSIFKKRSVVSALTPTGAPKADPALDLPRLERLRDHLERLDTLAADAGRIAGWAGVSTEIPRFADMLDVAAKLRIIIARAADTPTQVAELRAAVRAVCVEANEMLTAEGAVGRAAVAYDASHARFDAALAAFKLLASPPRQIDAPDLLMAIDQACETIRGRAPELNAWCAWRRARQAACDHGLQRLVEGIEAGAVPSGGALETFEIAYARWWAACVIDGEPTLRDFNLNEHADTIGRFKQLDDEFADLTQRVIRARLCAEIPAKDARNQPPGFGALAHQLKLQKRHKPVRQLVADMGPALATLAPCLLMSPLSVAQYLPPDAAQFDLVIFDEASQITPWDAVGAIARGRQLVVAGDPKQMPPTSFFDRGASSDGDDIDAEEDQESILEECLGARLPQRRLTWHYRSRHESLIAFSNHRYYDGDLITFPAPVTRASAVSLVQVDGAWSRGKSRTNQAEAEAIVAEAVRRLTDPVSVDEKGRKLSLAVITLNAEQQKLVEDLLDRARQRRPELEPFFAEDVQEPVVVKNLETVQGDERDIVLLGIGYGPETPGAPSMPMNFGPLNRGGGWRRLNVAITRARREMVVFASFPPYLIDLNRTSAEAVRDLKHFLEYAERGPRALGEAVAGSVGGFESPFEQAVARGLRERGWAVVPQVGVSRFRIDLGIVHPDRPGDFLAGVECDGAAYHSAATARDRDKVREAVLKSLGWSLLRVWSTDWWIDARHALERLDAGLRAVLDGSRAAQFVTAAAAEAVMVKRNFASPGNVELAPARVEEGEPLEEPDAGPAAAQNGGLGGTYRLTNLDELSGVIDPERFYDDDYTRVVRDMISRVVSREAPIRDDLLIERIARAHGFKRSGRLIRDRILSLVRGMAFVGPEGDGAVFVWPDDSMPAQWSIARTPATPGDIRPIEDIALEELRALMVECGSDDPEVEAARRLGIRRLTAASRERLRRAAPIRVWIGVVR